LKRGAGGKTTEVGPQTANAQVMPVLDEGTFQQILEAAYVLQEQNHAQRAVRIGPDASATLAEIAETQQLLRSQLYDLHSAAGLVAERLQKITHATSIVIALIREHQLEYCAATGKAEGLAGSSAPMDPALAQFLQEGDPARCIQVNAQLSAELLRKQDAKAPTFFPVYHDAKIAGVLQLTFPEKAPIQESEIRSCQVMAGLLGEVIGRSAEAEWKQALATERATMLDALEQLRPQLERLAMQMPKAIKDAAAEALPASSPVEAANPPAPELIPSQTVSQAPSAGTATCGQCGYHFGDGELFCGRCGTPRAMNVAASGDLPANWDALWQSLQQPAAEEPASDAPAPVSQPVPEHPPGAILPEDLEAAILELAKEMSPHATDPSLPFDEPEVPRETTRPEAKKLNILEAEPPITEEVAQPVVAKQENVLAPPLHPEIVAEKPAGEHWQPHIIDVPSSTPELSEPEAPFALEEAHSDSTVVETQSHGEVAAEEKPELQIVPGKEKPKPSPWGSAAKAREWLNSLEQANSPARVWLSKHRADLWVGLSIILLFLALSGWGTRSVSYPTQVKAPAQPSLSLFERMLVSLGLAEAPPAPVYLGNPNVRVWVDLHTALYYCPDSDLYGKTVGGKFTTQRDAQMDQFEPAANRPCD